MAGGFRSVLPPLGISAPEAQGGYITLPWWQAGGGIGPDPPIPPVEAVIKGAGGEPYGYFDEEEEILAVIAAYTRVRGPFPRH